jgi:hypothetical protein
MPIHQAVMVAARARFSALYRARAAEVRRKRLVHLPTKLTRPSRSGDTDDQARLAGGGPEWMAGAGATGRMTAVRLRSNRSLTSIADAVCSAAAPIRLERAAMWDRCAQLKFRRQRDKSDRAALTIQALQRLSPTSCFVLGLWGGPLGLFFGFLFQLVFGLFLSRNRSCTSRIPVSRATSMSATSARVSTVHTS